MLQGAHHRLADAVEEFVEGITHQLRLGNDRGGQGAHLDGHHGVVGLAQAFEPRDLVVGRQAEADQLFVGRQGDFPLQPV
ncbi:hypothetical protein D3C75_1014620 [compost metagenome]